MDDYHPRFKVGDVIRIPHVTPGHDRHDPKAFYRIKWRHIGTCSKSTTYQLNGNPSNWPESRLSFS
jgi:hypothetical protein